MDGKKKKGSVYSISITDRLVLCQLNNSLFCSIFTDSDFYTRNTARHSSEYNDRWDVHSSVNKLHSRGQAYFSLQISTFWDSTPHIAGTWLTTVPNHSWKYVLKYAMSRSRHCQHFPKHI